MKAPLSFVYTSWHIRIVQDTSRKGRNPSIDYHLQHHSPDDSPVEDLVSSPTAQEWGPQGQDPEGCGRTERNIRYTYSLRGQPTSEACPGVQRGEHGQTLLVPFSLPYELLQPAPSDLLRA